MLRRYLWFVVLITGVLVCAWGCGGWTTYDEYKCSNPNTTVTYNNFVKGFLDKWCNYCHSVTSENRRGAPIAYVFDTYASVVALKKRIFLRSAANNITMPPGPDDPPLEERNKLAEWIVCGTPR